MKKILYIKFLFFYLYLGSQQRIEQLDMIFEKYNVTLYKNADSAFYYCKKAEKLNKEIGNEYYKSRCLFCYALYYYYIGKPRLAIVNNENALSLAYKTKNISCLYRCHNLKGLLFYEKGEFSRAFIEYRKALYYIRIHPENKYYAIIYSNLGNLFSSQKDTISALKYYNLNLKFANLAHDTSRIFSGYVNIANVMKEKNFKKSESYYIKAFLLAQKMNDKLEQFNIRINQCTLYQNEDNIFRKELVLQYLKEAKELIGEIKDNSLYFYYYYSYAAFFRRLNNYKNAIINYEKALTYYNPEKLPIEQKISILKHMNIIYKLNKNYQKAYEYQSKFYKLKDSLFSMEKEKNYNQLLAKFEVEKKNGQIQLLSKQNELEKVRKNRLVYISGLALLLLVLSLFFFRSRLRNEKKLSLKQQELNRTRGILEGQSEERNRLAKELHDGVAGSLVGLKLMLYNENEKLKSDKLSTIQNHIDGLYGEIREISHNLSNNFLQDKSFQDLVRNLSERYETRNIFKTEVLFYPEDALNDIDYELKVNLYRIVQEIFTNIQKHAKAENVYFSVTQGEDSVSLIIEDDGIGISENTKEGVGVKNIRERLNLYGGELKIDGNEGKGTSIIIEFKV